MPNSPDVEWSLCFADAIHDVRVALESLAWELAHLNGASPKNPKDVNFPIARSPEALNRKLDAVFPRIHSKVAERIKYFQSFNIDDPERSWLSIISDLDNEDKHRGAVFTAPSMTGASFHFGELGMGPEVAGDGGSRVEYVEPLSSVPVGGNLASITFGLEI